MRTFRKLAIAASLLAIPASCAEPDPEGVRFFETKIRPVLATRCFVCHAAAAPKIQAALLLDSAAGLRKGGNSGPAVEPGQPDRSLLLRALRYQDKDLKMPPGKALPPDVVADFETWIRIGAPMPPDTQAAG